MCTTAPPTPVTAFMATGVKAAAFAALFRVLTEAFATPGVQEIVWWLAVVTMAATSWLSRSARSSACSRTPQCPCGLLLVACLGEVAGTASSCTGGLHADVRSVRSPCSRPKDAAVRATS